MALKLLLGSGFSLALLALAAWRVRAAAIASRARARACERGDRFLLDSVRSLLEASRRSSDAVLFALDGVLRGLDRSIDSVLVFVPAGDELVCRYGSGARAEHFRQLRLRRDDLAPLPARAAVNRCRARMPHDGDALMPTDRAALAVPMLDAHELRAVVYASSPEANAVALHDTLVRAIEQAAMPYAIALEREADRVDATYDALTGLLAPRAFRRLLHDEIARADNPHGRVLSLWFIDTDRFKSVNDEFGHRAGDAVLQAMASLLRAHLVPEIDLAARNGGDEFCALIRASTKSLAIERAGAFCEAVRVHSFGIPVRVTASIGVATFPYDAASSAALLEAADAAMYHSKRDGRDRVSFIVEPGICVALSSEAASGISRSSARCSSDVGDSAAQRSPY